MEKRLYWHCKNDKLEEISLKDAFPFIAEKHHIISLVGAGGKTTTMYELATEAAGQGVHTLVTTTTHIGIPEQEHVWADSVENLRQIWEHGGYGVMGVMVQGKKLAQLPEKEFYGAVHMSEMVFLEADGAKCLPCKVPAEHEPVLIPECDIVIGVVGLDTIGQPAEQVCFRLGETMELLQIHPEHRMCEEELVRILISDKGTHKNVHDREYYIVLNKCDDEDKKKSAKHMAELLREAGMKHVVISGRYEGGDTYV